MTSEGRGSLISWVFVCAILFAYAVASPAAAQQFRMKISSPTVNDVTQAWMDAFKKQVEASSGRKIQVELYPAGQLGPIPATVDGVALGTIEVVIPATGFLGGLEPRFQVFDLPGIYTDMAHAQRVLADPAVIAMYRKFGASKGVEPLAIIAHGPAMIISHDPIRTTADFAGKKVRVIAGTPLFVNTAKSLGMSPIAMPLGEVLPALQNKAIDGSVTGLTVLTSMKYYDVAKSITSIPGGIIAVGALANSAFLKSLGPELEKIVRDSAIKATADTANFGVGDVDVARALWTKNRGEVIDLSSAEVEKYNKAVISALPSLLNASASLKSDYETMLSAAARHKK